MKERFPIFQNPEISVFHHSIVRVQPLNGLRIPAVPDGKYLLGTTCNIAWLGDDLTVHRPARPKPQMSSGQVVLRRNNRP